MFSAGGQLGNQTPPRSPVAFDNSAYSESPTSLAAELPHTLLLSCSYSYSYFYSLTLTLTLNHQPVSAQLPHTLLRFSRERKYGQECSGNQRSIRLIPDFFPAQSELLAVYKTALGQLSFGRRSGPCLPIYLVTRMRRQVWRCHSITLPLWNAPTNTISDQTIRHLIVCLFVFL